MMRQHTPTSMLRDEHRLILRVVDAFEDILSKPEPPLDVVADCIVFFRLFTDACHHGKEEDLLFAALEDQQLPGVGDAIDAMRDEHVRGRELVRQIDAALHNVRSGDRDRQGALATAAAAYIDFIRTHIAREDHGLFDLADDLMHGPACAALCDAYETVCARRFEGRSLQDLEDLAGRIVGRP